MHEASTKKALAYQATHRGIKETDLLLGRFVDNFLETLSTQELETFAEFLKTPDQDILAWVMDQETPPHAYTWIIKKLRP